MRTIPTQGKTQKLYASFFHAAELLTLLIAAIDALYTKSAMPPTGAATVLAKSMISRRAASNSTPPETMFIVLHLRKYGRLDRVS